MGIDSDEGVVVAYIPSSGDMLDEELVRDGTREFVLYSVDDVVLDAIPMDGKPVKMWQVKELARQAGMGIVEPIQLTTAGEFSIDRLPDVPQPKGKALAIRQYSRGPWIKL